jgi:hypothetical protein
MRSSGGECAVRRIRDLHSWEHDWRLYRLDFDRSYYGFSLICQDMRVLLDFIGTGIFHFDFVGGFIPDGQMMDNP